MWASSSSPLFSLSSSFSSVRSAFPLTMFFALSLSLTLCQGCASLSPRLAIAEETQEPQPETQPETQPTQPIVVEYAGPDYSAQISAVSSAISALDSHVQALDGRVGSLSSSLGERLELISDEQGDQGETLRSVRAGTDLLSLRVPAGDGEAGSSGVASSDDAASVLSLDLSSPFVLSFLAPGLSCGALLGVVFQNGWSSWGYGETVTKYE